ncbi:MAG: squalene synthase HpnC [Phycisphaerales bacterium]
MNSPTLAISMPGDAPLGVGPGSAAEHVDRLARTHYENFPVLTRLVPRDLRADFGAVYAYCRTCDDLGDETGVGPEARLRSLELLAEWRRMLEGCVASASDEAAPASVPAPTHPVFVALAKTIRKHRLPAAPFHHLIDAFEQDQRITRYETWTQLLDYCTRSADPVGRIILHLSGVRPEHPDWDELVTMSDATCTALQLTNFWQDVRRDLLERDRVYLPRAETGLSDAQLRAWLDETDGAAGSLPDNRVRYIRAVRALCERTRTLFERGRPLPGRLGGPMGRVVWMFGAGGERVLDRVERAGCTTLWHRPKLGKLAKLSIVVAAAFRSFGPARPVPPGGPGGRA